MMHVHKEGVEQYPTFIYEIILHVTWDPARKMVAPMCQESYMGEWAL